MSEHADRAAAAPRGPSSELRRLRLGHVELDPLAGEVHRDEEVFSLEPQPAKVLQVLVERPGEVVRRDELKRHLWGDQRHVEADQGLNYCISELRRALGDSARDPRFIETLPRRGYRFVAPVEPLEPVEQPLPPPEADRDGEAGTVESEAAGPPASGRSPATNGPRERAERRPMVAVLALSTVFLLVLAATLVELPSAAGPGDAPAPEGGSGAAAEGTIAADGIDSDGGEIAAAEAHRLVTRARFLSAQRDVSQKEKALDLVREAIRFDPDSAGAHLLFGTVLLDLPRPPRSTAPQARDAFERALALDPDLAEAHVALGRIELFYRRQLDQAGRSIRRALELEPGLADAHYNLALLLAARGRDPEAVASMHRARELDPLSPVIHADMGFIHYFGGRWGEAILTAREVLDLDPENRLAPLLGLLSAIQLGEDEMALEYGRLLAMLTGGPRRPIERLTDYWRWQLDWYRFELDSGRYRNPMIAARAHVQLGEHEKAIEEIAAACEERSGWFMPFLAVDPGWGPLADHPRFPALLACARGVDPPPPAPARAGSPPEAG